jgi:hypothetical protein
VPIFSHSWTIPQAFRKLLFRCSIAWRSQNRLYVILLTNNNIDTAQMRSDYFLASIVVIINRVSTESLYECGGTCTDSGMLRVNVRLVCGQRMYLQSIGPPKLRFAYYCSQVTLRNICK